MGRPSARGSRTGNGTELTLSMTEKSRPPQDEDVAKALGTLSLGPDAPWEEVKRRHKRLAFKNHEAKVGAKGADLAALVNWSYAVLKEAYLVHSMLPQRKVGDRSAGFRPYFREAKSEAESPESSTGQAGKEDEQGESSSGKWASLDLRKTVKIDLLKAAMGGEVTIRGSYRAVCAACKGAGKAAEATVCKTCSGSGRRKVNESTSGLCTTCNGAGTVRATCGWCMGSGKGAQREDYAYQVCIPAWTRPGTKLRLRGRGSEGPDGKSRGDLFIEVEVESTEGLQVLESGDVVGTLLVNPLEWLAGGVVHVRTLSGIREVEIEAGQTRMTLDGEGFERAGGLSRGALVYRVQVDLKGNLDQTGRLLVEKAKAHWHTEGQDEAKQHKAWVERVKRRQRQSNRE